LEASGSTAGRRRWLLIASLASCAALAVALAVCAGLIAYWQRDLRRAVDEFERDVGPLDDAPWTTTPRGSELGDDSAAKWLIAGANAIDLEVREQEWPDLPHRKSHAEWSPEEVGAVRALVARHRSALDTMARAVPLSDWSFPVRYEDPPERPWEWRPPKVSPPSPDDPVLMLVLRQGRGSRVARLAGELAFHDGECRAAIVHMELLARQAVVVGRLPEFLGPVVATSSAREALELGQEMVRGCSSSESVERWLGALGEMERRRLSADRAFGNLAIWIALAERAERRECARHGLGCQLRRWLAPAWRGSEAGSLDWWRALVVASREPWPEPQRVIAELEWRRRWWQPDDRMLMPNLIDGIQQIQATESAVRLARVAATVRLAGLRGGVYPTLDELPAFAGEATPFQGEVPRYESVGAGARLSLPRSAAAWKTTWAYDRPTTSDNPDLRPPIPFEWVLPPLPGAATRAANDMEGRP
jgi:hypothetical protein